MNGIKDVESYFDSVKKAAYVSLVYDWKMSSITASLAITQLEKIEKLISLRRNNAHYLSSKSKKLPGVLVPKEPTGYKHVYRLYSYIAIQFKKS